MIKDIDGERLRKALLLRIEQTQTLQGVVQASIDRRVYAPHSPEMQERRYQWRVLDAVIDTYRELLEEFHLEAET